MKISMITFALLSLCFCATLTPARAQTGPSPPDMRTAPAARPVNRFSDAGAATAPVTSAGTPKAPSARKKVAAGRDPWYVLALAAFLSLRFLAWIAGFIAIFCVLSLAFSHAMYRSHQPQTAHGVARWGVFWALLVCGLLPLLLPLVFPYTFAWSWAAWMLLSFPFTLTMLILLIILLTNRPAHSR